MGRKGIHFLKTVGKSEAERIWHDALRLGPLGGEEVAHAQALGRVLDGEILRVDVVTRDIRDALDLIIHPLRLKVTLRK